MLEKNCVSLLQEHCAQNKFQPPLYEELQPERSGNTTIFKYKVQICLLEGTFEATGTGLNKNSAKQSAATELCDKIGIKSEVSSDNSFSDISLCSLVSDLSLDESMTLEKTPVSLLNEFCAKNRISTPFYADLSCDNSVFKCKAVIRYQGEAREGIGSGTNKKNAKQSAARSLLDLLGIKFDWSLDETDQDTVSILNHLCSTNNYCAPNYEDVRVTGPPHCREFTLRCTVGSVAKEAKGPSKKLAKQCVAKDILKSLHEMNQSDLDKLKLNSNAPEFLIQQEMENYFVDAKYRQYKKSSCKKPITNSERHNFYVSYLDENQLENARRVFVSGKHESLREKVEKMLDEAGLKFIVTQVPSSTKPMYAFELLHDRYDCYIVAFGDEFWSRVADYFIVMLNIPTTSVPIE